MFVEFFIKRPIFASVCSLIIVLAGLICIPTLPVAQYPDIASPQVSVTSNYIGASAEVVESAVTVPLEQEINGVQGMKYMTSTSTNDGASTITITFDVGRNIDDAVVDVQNRVATATARLPDAVKATGVTIRKNSPALVLVYGLYDERGQYDNFFLSNYADRYIVDPLKRINGVGEVRIFGERKYAMRLWLEPDKLARRNLTASDVVSALREQNVQVAAGQIGQPPNADSQPYQMSIRAMGRLTNTAQFEDMVVHTNADGSLIRLKDVGRAELGAESYSSLLRFNGRDAVGLGIFQLPSANALDLAKQIKERMETLSQRFPPGMKAMMTLDTTHVIQESLTEVVFTLVMSIVLVVGVIYLFLQNWRSTIIPVITIPVSLIGTFIFMKIFGFSINTLTLFGLTLATGLVVDDAIIVIENIERFIQEKGMSPMRAASEAMKEVFGAVLAASLVLIAVFVPVAFFPGTTGLLYKQFALTIAFSIAISAFNAFTLTPALSALLLQKTHPKENTFFRTVNKGIHAMRESLYQGLKRTMSVKPLVLVLFVVLIGVTVWLFKQVPTGFIPNEDQGYFLVTVQGPEGTSINYTQGIMNQVNAQLKTVEEVAATFSISGFSFAGSGPNKGMLFVSLKPLEERKKAEQGVAGVIQKLRPQLMSIPGAIVMPFEPPAIRGVGSFGGFQFELQEETDRDLNVLFNTVQTFGKEGNQGNILTGIFSSFTVNDPQLRVTVDRYKAKSLNVNLQELFSTMQVYLGSQYVNDFDFLNRIYRVYVQADQKYRSEPNDIGSLYVRSQDGAMIPMSNLVKVERAYTPQAISHYNMFRSAEINGSPKPGYSTGQAIQEMEALAAKNLPQGMRFEWSGIALEQTQSGQQTLLIFTLSFLFVFLVLAAQYESWLDPFVIMMAIPLALLGALGAQGLRGLENDVFAQIGLVMLIGLATKNAILIVEFANQLREQGHSIVEAAIEATRIRFRPILMTSLAFILGILPLVIASGAGSAARHSMGTAVFGGMLVSTVLNLFVIPVLYVLMASLREKVWNRSKAVVVEEHSVV
ncbi:MAG: efflux system, inner rane transporter CmeB [Vampirovibrio sp.]|jgi:HAE1 family hydrophobic/amphiphilic exporter-1|nr:efflux system, inner rane transporter CmeB [Vampirovibrio sp.]